MHLPEETTIVVRHAFTRLGGRFGDVSGGKEFREAVFGPRPSAARRPDVPVSSPRAALL